MKRLGTGLLALGLFFALSSSVWANEGLFRLASDDNKNGSCFAVSVYYDERYRVLMTCRGLRSAVDPVRNKYVVWLVKSQNLRRLGEIHNGKMRASSDKEFDKLEVTAEKNAYLNKPEGEVLLVGRLEEIKFEGIAKKKKEDFPTSLGSRGSVSVKVAAEKKAPAAGAASTFKAVGKALLIGFGVLILVVGFLSYSSRKGK